MKTQERDQLLKVLHDRFERHTRRHPGVAWKQVLQRLEAAPAARSSLARMEASGGEPDVIGQDPATGQFIFCDCAAESPSGRRSLFYDRQALESRKENKPEGSAVESAQAMGVELLTEAQYRALQQLGEFDLKTSAGLPRPRTSAPSVVCCSATGATARCSFITMACSRTMRHGAFAAGFSFEGAFGHLARPLPALLSLQLPGSVS